MVIPMRNKIIVFARCGNRCSFPDCEQIIAFRDNSERYANVGMLAHIKGDKGGSARYDPNQLEEERNSPDNIILVCGTHHKTIDDQPDIYTIEKLIEIKLKHEEWVIKQYSRSINSLTFVELEDIKKFIKSGDFIESDMSVIHLKDKIKKNEISSQTEILIKLGLSRTKLVKEYIDTNLDSEFGERLKKGFVQEYNHQKDKSNGDVLFNNLLKFATGGSSDFKDMATGLTVLCYFFETCDVFEK